MREYGPGGRSPATGDAERLMAGIAASFEAASAWAPADLDAALTEYEAEGLSRQDAELAFEYDRRVVGQEQLDAATAYSRRNAAQAAAGVFDPGGLDIQPYPAPSLPFDRAKHGPGHVPNGPRVATVRRLWLARFNPADERWDELETTGEPNANDVAAPDVFGWDDPAEAIRRGNYWLSTMATPANRGGIEQIELGDLVVVQRTTPATRELKDRHLITSAVDPQEGRHSLLWGLAAAWQIEQWNGPERRETRVALLPLVEFDFPVSRTQLTNRARLQSDRFSNMRQLLDGTGAQGRTVIPITDDRDINELLYAIGLPPDVLSEPDLRILSARARATTTGNENLHRLRWDHRYRHQVRSAHERKAIAAAKKWAGWCGWVYAGSTERIPCAGSDLVFTDRAVPARLLNRGRGHARADDPLAVCWTNQVEVEVKGYTATDLAYVHLQPSQQQRARDSIVGHVPPWWLYAVTGIRTRREQSTPLNAVETVALLDSGALSNRLVVAVNQANVRVTEGT